VQTKVPRHLLKDGKEIPRERDWLRHTIKLIANELLEEIDELCLKGEREFIQESLKSKAIPRQNYLWITRHKTKWGQHPTRLVIPATNFTSAFQKLGYLGIKKILHDANIDYVKKTIVQASRAKTFLESLGANKSTHAMFSLAIESFYPSVTHTLVEIAINYFATNLQMGDKLMIREFLKLIHFGMANTLVTFGDKCFEQ
jgi:hypothetical protein